MDVSFVIRQRLEEFGLDQRELARAAQVTESYISQLLTRKKAPPAPGRTDIYDKMDRFLKLPSGELARLAAVQRRAELKRELGEEPAPLFREVRELILRKCHPDRERQVLICRFFLDLNEAETAQGLACPRGSVKARTSRGLARLRATQGEEVRHG